MFLFCKFNAFFLISHKKNKKFHPNPQILSPKRHREHLRTVLTPRHAVAAAHASSFRHKKTHPPLSRHKKSTYYQKWSK
jgi:hypothetical protein